MKGRQVALTLYLPPDKYWLLKDASERTGQSMQTLLRHSLDKILLEEHLRASRATALPQRAPAAEAHLPDPERGSSREPAGAR